MPVFLTFVIGIYQDIGQDQQTVDDNQKHHLEIGESSVAEERYTPNAGCVQNADPSLFKNMELVPAYSILLGMVPILGVIIAFPRVFGRKDRYGILADGVFLLPGLIVWLG